MRRNLWAGLDVGVETTALCVIDDDGKVLQKTTCATSLAAIHEQLAWLRRRRAARIGMEAATGAAVARGLRSRGYTVDMYETRQLSTFLKVRRNKTDDSDAFGIAQAGRLASGIVSKVYLKSFESQSLQSRLTIRRFIIRERVAVVNLLCRQLEVYGGRVRRSIKAVTFRPDVELEITRIFAKQRTYLALELRRLLDKVDELTGELARMDADLIRSAKENEICRRFMQIPGVGPICALTFYAAIGDPQRFGRTSDVGAFFGLTPTIHQSGLSCRIGRISRMGNNAVRALLVQSSMSFLRFAAPSCTLRIWAEGVEARRGRRKATIALARKLSIIMLAMWKTGQSFKSNSTEFALPEPQQAPDSGPCSAPQSALAVMEPAL